MSNLHALGTATQMYLMPNRDRTPAGHYNNAGGISPKGTGLSVGTRLPNGLEVWDSIGGLLKSCLSGDPKTIYRCPSASNTGDDNFEISGTNPFSGIAPDDVFKPNYFYMCTAQWINLAPNAYWYPQVWATRNVANIPLSSVRRPAETIAWLDESTSHHTSSHDIYGRNAKGRLNVDDVDHFAYLDGHVDQKKFRNLCGYFDSLHGPLSQRQWGEDIVLTPDWPVANDFPPGCK